MASTAIYPIGKAIVHHRVITESSAQLAAMCEAQGLDTHVDARAESRKQELLAERLLLKEIFGNAVVLTHNDDRAPFINVDGKWITIAHTGGQLLIAVADEKGLGIDIEHLERNARCERVRKAFINEAEQRWLPENDIRHIYMWVAKEAIFKAVAVRRLVDSYRDDISVDAFQAPVDGGQVSVAARFKEESVHLTLIRQGGLAIAFAQRST